MKLNLKTISIILFYGAIWGIVEASVGYVLHFLPTLIAGTILFPFASIILYRTYQQTQSSASLLGVGIVAATIKAINFLLPVTNVFKIINPMISIILEALVVMVVVRSLVKSKWVMKVTLLTLASITWRVIFLGYMGIQALTTGFVAQQIASMNAMVSFAIVSGVLAGAMSFVLLLLLSIPAKLRKPVIQISPILSMLTLSVAFVLTLIL